MSVSNVEVAHNILGLTAIANAFTPMVIYFTFYGAGSALISFSVYHLFWKIFWVSSLATWAIPAILYPFTFSGLKVIDYLFTVVIENYLIALPFTWYWALSLAFILTAYVHNPSRQESTREVWVTAWSYMAYACTTSAI